MQNDTLHVKCANPQCTPPQYILCVCACACVYTYIYISKCIPHIHIHTYIHTNMYTHIYISPACLVQMWHKPNIPWQCANQKHRQYTVWWRVVVACHQIVGLFFFGEQSIKYMIWKTHSMMTCGSCMSPDRRPFFYWRTINKIKWYQKHRQYTIWWRVVVACHQIAGLLFFWRTINKKNDMENTVNTQYDDTW